MELIALIGISVTVITIGVTLAALILNTQRNLRADMRTEFKAVRAEMQAQREETKLVGEFSQEWQPKGRPETALVQFSPRLGRQSDSVRCL